MGQLLRAHRLVTITGPGGVGKSSLGVEVARSLSHEFPSAFVPIESNRDAPVWNVVAASLGLQGQDLLADRSKDLIGDEPVLLVLDGCEHALDAVTEVTAELLTGCPNVRILVTSREPLAATGERVVTVGPLDDGDGSAANQLFLDRAGLDGILDEASLSLVTTIGTRLAGLPLGLELAAARARTMSLEEITARLDDQPSLLRTKRSAVPHQRSIVAALDWSYDLLDPEAQRVFRLLGALPTGSISLAAARAVLDVETPEDALRPLFDASIIARSVDDPGEYVILEPIRQYAEMKLESSGELEDARLRLGEWIARLCLQVHLDYLSGDLFASTKSLRRHWPGIAAAAEWAVESGHPEVTLAIIAGAGRRWPHVADPDVLIAPGMAALEAPGSVDPGIRLRALAHLAYLHTPQRSDEALVLLERLGAERMAMEEVDPIADQVVESIRNAVPYRATHARWMPPEARAEALWALDRSIEIATEMGYPAEPHLYNRALILELEGDLDESRRHLDRLVEWAGTDRPVWRGLGLHVIAKRQVLDGDLGGGLASATEAARLLVDADDLDFAAEAEFMISHISAEAERFDAAQESIERIDTYHRQVGLDPVAIDEPDLDAEVAAGLGDWSRFINSATRFIHEIPGPEEPDARAYFLEGEPGNISRVAAMVPPTVRYLAANGARNAASRLAGAMPNFARMSTSPDVYKTSGLLSRTARLADELDLPIPSNVPSSPEEVFEAIRRAISTDGASRD